MGLRLSRMDFSALGGLGNTLLDLSFGLSGGIVNALPLYRPPAEGHPRGLWLPSPISVRILQGRYRLATEDDMHMQTDNGRPC